MKNVKICVLLVTFAIFLAACAQTATNSPSNVNVTAVTPAAPSPTIDQAVFAKDLYAKNCMICHRDSGKGGKVTIEGKTLDPDDLTTARMKAKTDEKLAAGISEGAPDDGMPAFKEKLSPEQINAVVRHVRTLQGS